ncbi:hypothetical protein [Burkholderia sp. WTPI3]|nr:hypothetical protein [Burkholderia sp. WTPI3]
MRRYPQQVWSEGLSCAGRYTALFARHPAHLQFEKDGALSLYYLGFRSEPSFHLADAPRAAPAFVRDVQAHMAALVPDAPQRSATGGHA